MSPVADDKTTDAAVQNRHPLDKFWGTVNDIYDDERPQRNNASRFNNFIILDFNNIEILKAHEVYNFPVTKIELMELNFPNTEWETFKESLRNCGFTGQLNNIIGKRMLMEFRPAMLNQQRRDGVTGYAVQPGHSWQVVEIEGVENTSGKLIEVAVELANGANAAEFKTKFMADGGIRTLTGYTEMLTGVMNNTLLPTLVAGGKLALNGDIYSKV